MTFDDMIHYVHQISPGSYSYPQLRKEKEQEVEMTGGFQWLTTHAVCARIEDQKVQFGQRSAGWLGAE